MSKRIKALVLKRKTSGGAEEMAPSVQWLLPVAGIKMPAPRQLIEGSVYRGSQSRMLKVHQSREARRLQAWWLEQEAGRSHLPLQTPSKE